ncbi:hormogonium polysaccharide biosynthesis protein HpsA [Lyngbya sp. CCAP 1446/10]|uniref:hormogonium polysaccharide biosynthesis protein HpsA n=1 Tax=Lyngbya sp. CCAP 1446/10 TaxID=439293 RepID=UPI00223859A1|nr:hormogonium polysaccharide biosynthesis protein HpsA [Lyngbya sp. CCAP 1446/10]MCW6052139.1 hormogonium polysaccharide biosynthesis protein HpsA [Lyngbya sp. CCAP 1446/10]
MFKSKLSRVIVSLLRRIAGVTRSGANRLMRAMLRALMAMSRRAQLPVAGFVLPTVTMVLLVVILLTVAITLRSFDRANTARNVRVNQQVLAAATPAIDRAKAKIQFMLKEDPQRPTATPSDNEMYRMMSAADSLQAPSPKDIYTFGDETRLRLKYDLNGNKVIDPNAALPDAEKDEQINTAWRYAVDTDNNGKFDTFTLYGVYFRSPERKTNFPDAGTFIRARQPLEARTPPMTGKISDPKCAAAAGTSASLVGDSGWYKSEGKLKKSFFVYTVNMPITKTGLAALDANTHEEFKGTTSFSALEYQQDQSRIPLSNNAVVYEDDLEISPGAALRINGRMFTNSNLLITAGGNLDLFQVSSKDSCFYEQENSKIIVSGNVVNGGLSAVSKDVGVHFFKKGNTPDITPTISTSTDSVKNTALDVLYNNKAYADRLSLLVKQQSAKAETEDPTSVINRKISLTRKQALEGYFKDKLRKVPFAEVAMEGNSYVPNTDDSATVIVESKDTLRPIDAWNLPNGDALKGVTSGPGTIEIDPKYLQATNPEKPDPPTEEFFLGDRIQVGNNLPAQRWDDTSTPNKFIGTTPQEVDGSTKWDGGDTTENRTRTPRVTQLADVGSTDRAGFWELAAAEAPKTAVDGVGGLRLVTGGGVYERVNSFLPPPGWDDPRTTPVEASSTYDDPATGTVTTVQEKYPIVWPDTMPMSPVLGVQQVYNNSLPPSISNWNLPTSLTTTITPTIDPNTKQYAKGDLRMRATAVYHYADNAYDPTKPDPGQTPIACISSYYDPSTSSTARNFGTTLPDVSGDFVPGSTTVRAGTRDLLIGSNNGVVYGRPTKGRPGAASAPDTITGLLAGGGDSDLEKQANYVFPNGRFANEPLRNALLKAPASRTLADNAAIDATMCAFGILGTPTFTLAPKSAIRGDIPDGAIKEVAFLDGRDIKAIDRNDPITTVDETFTLSSPLTGNQKAKLSGKYDLALEERQPLEIRATVLDIGVMRGDTATITPSPTGPKNASGKEYLLPYSGIIYATRDDALPDRSDRQAKSTGEFDEDTSKTVSPTDSRLDPTRRPNGIMLINGEKLFRGGATPATVTSVEDVVKEKGLTLVSNLPVYIKGEFNKHTKEEFTQPLDPTWSNFYTRSTLDTNFACRLGDTRFSPPCGGDDWRPATVLGDAVTLLSGDFREGFRNEGDFDLRNNVGTAAVVPRRNQGFYNNNFVTNGLSSGAFNITGVVDNSSTMTDKDYWTVDDKGLNSSYFNNFVTPIQRRGDYPEYLMEVCTKLPVSECKATDWYVDPTPATQLRATAIAIGTPYDRGTHKAGTTFDPPDTQLQRFPRRVAFQRTASDDLASASNTKVTVLGIEGSGSGNIKDFDTSGSIVPRRKPNSLWFASATNTPPLDFGNTNPLFFLNRVTALDDTSKFQLIDGEKTVPKITDDLTQQPLLMPVLQISRATNTSPATDALPVEGSIAEDTKWMLQIPQGTKTQVFNLIVGSGDVPSRNINGTTGEFNGGMQNLPRFLENWRKGGIDTKILGAFIQLNRSAYSTAPYFSLLGNSTRSAFSPTGVNIWYEDTIKTNRYKIANAAGAVPFFSPPNRNWGFDVGLLSQSPDLFTQRFTTPSTKTQPAEFFREVPRNDDWVQTLMCAFINDPDPTKTGPKAVSDDLRPNSFCTSKAGA